MWLRPCWRGSEGSSCSSRVLLTSHMEKYQVETQIAEGGGGWVFRAV
eukprot:COSAG01_NODE_55383_length_317_cov_0.938053_2_plen_46_part_01